MADVFTHVLVAYVLFTLLSWRIDWIDRTWVVVGMVGAILPDLSRVDMIISADTIETTLGIPFNWGAIHTLGGVTILAAIGALIFAERRHQITAFVMLLGGGVSHLLLDAVKAWGDGYAGAFWYPLTWYRMPAPGWYVSADRWVFVLAVSCAVIVFVLDRHMHRNHQREASQ